MKIKNRILLYFLIPGLLITIIAVLVFYFFAAVQIKAEIKGRLVSVADSRADNLISYISLVNQKTGVIASDYQIGSCLANEEGFLNSRCLLDNPDGHLVEYLNKFSEFAEVFILDNEGKVKYSTIDGITGQDYSAKKVFIEGKSHNYFGSLYYSDYYEDYLFPSAVPIFYGSRFVGVAVTGVRTGGLYEVLRNGRGLGKSGEVFVTDLGGYLLSPLKQKNLSVAKAKISNENYISCVKHFNQYGSNITGVLDNEAKIFSYYNYNHQKVVGIHAHIPNLQWCLFAEVDAADGLLSVRNLTDTIIWLSVSVVVVIFLLAYYVGSRISKPISDLQIKAELVQEGNIDIKLDTGTDDEIGRLSRTIDKLKDYMTEMGKAVNRDFQKKSKDNNK